MLRENQARLYDGVAGNVGGVSIPGSLALTLDFTREACKETYYLLCSLDLKKGCEIGPCFCSPKMLI